MAPATAATRSQDVVAQVRDDPAGRLLLMRELYEHPAPGRARLPYRRAATAFMQWQIDRGLLEPGGSPWWRAVNEDLLRTTAEAVYLAAGAAGAPSGPAVSYGLDFIRSPSAQTWYRAHNMAIGSAYLDHLDLASAESRGERFFLNLILVRVLYAHALVASPEDALGWLSPLAPALGDPRLGMTSIFLSLSRVLPHDYPIGDDVTPYVAEEHGFGRVLDVGVIQPRLRRLYDWSAEELELPDLASLLIDRVPCYAWDPADREDWEPPITGFAKLARSAIPPRERSM